MDSAQQTLSDQQIISTNEQQNPNGHVYDQTEQLDYLHVT